MGRRQSKLPVTCLTELAAQALSVTRHHFNPVSCHVLTAAYVVLHTYLLSTIPVVGATGISFPQVIYECFLLNTLEVHSVVGNLKS